MSTPMRMALLGAGQLGGSFAWALRGSGNLHITAYDITPAHADTLHAMGAIDAVAASVADAVRDADIVVLAAPLRSYAALASAIAACLKPGTIVTDLGSVKGSMQRLEALLPSARIVGAHPIAGSEKSGPAAARSDLFRGKLCILTPHEHTDADALKAVETLWYITGADVLHMPAAIHDQVYAHVSHLPHYLAFLSAEYFFTLGARMETDDAMLRQFLRIAASSPRMWTDIALENRDALLPALATYIAVLDHFAGELRAGEPSEAEAVSAAKNLLPRLLASSLISTVSLYEKQAGMDLRALGAGGMRDIIAPAMSPPEADMEAISHASTTMANHLDAFLAQLRGLESIIGAEDETALFSLLSRCAEHAHALAMARQ